MVKRTWLCEGDPPCTCEAEHRSDICEMNYTTDNLIQEEGKEYYLGHEECKENCTCVGGKKYCKSERWVHEVLRCTNKGVFRKNCNGIFQHRMVLCEKHYKEQKTANDRRCRICGSEVRSCCC